MNKVIRFMFMNQSVDNFNGFLNDIMLWKVQNAELLEFREMNVDLGTLTLMFRKEQDLTLFLLRWKSWIPPFQVLDESCI